MVGANGGSISAIFISDHQWTADAVDSWITDVTVSDGEVNFTVEANPGEEPRDGRSVFQSVEIAIPRILQFVRPAIQVNLR